MDPVNEAKDNTVKESAEKVPRPGSERVPHRGFNRTIRMIIGAIFVFIITFSAISICQNIGKTLRADVTEQKLYSLSDGTKAILAKLNQPIMLKLYYAKTAAMKGPDQIRYFNNYYEFVKSLLEQYVVQAKGMVDLKIIDPRPYSEQEVEALQYGLQRFSISEEENFFFGLVAQTQFGVEKVIPFFSPDRQNFIEYDISYLIDTAVTRQKKRLGIMSSLPVMGDETSSYMAQMMRMQGKQPTPPWTFVEQLRKKYEVTEVPTDVNDINFAEWPGPDVDILLVIHPKALAERTLFAIDQFVLKGGRTIVCIDPHCVADRPDRRTMQMPTAHQASSELDVLLKTWGLRMPENTFAGDRSLALRASITRNQRPETIIAFLNLGQGCFNTDTVITTNLNQVRVLFAGVLREMADVNEANIERTPLITTTDKGNSFTVDSSAELMFLQPAKLMSSFYEGTEPITMGYLVTGRLASSFPDGIEVEVESSETEDPNDDSKKTTKLITGLKQAEQDCVVAVFSDVDFISDMLAYQESFFGKLIVGDNSALLMNTIDDLTGSSDLISIRSRGNFQRPFTVVKEIETQAEKETAEEVAKLNAEIQGFNNELQQILASAKKEKAEIVGSSILQKQRQLELKKRQAQRQLREVRKKRHYRIEQLGNSLRNFNMLTAPAVILVIAVVLAVRRSVRKRHYISHASDA
jgi:ABC-2 type transport system permease protein